MERSCQACSRSEWAFAEPRRILLCRHKPGAVGALSVVSPRARCLHFKAPASPRTDLAPPPASDSARLIPLTQAKFASVDADDYDWLNSYKWYATHHTGIWYAFSRRRGLGYTSMHRLIARPPDGMVVDHIDHNGLNNTRANLRVCTPQQNSRNRRSQSGRSKYKGISYDKRYKRWKARIRFQNKYIHIGTFRDEARAARAYDAKAAELFGEFACLNFPPS